MDIEQSLREGIAARQAEKAAAFRRLQTESPDVAAFLTAMSAEFGKPAAVEIEYGDGSTFKSGAFLDAQKHGDFWKRFRVTQTFFANLKFQKNRQRT